jgi:hypothetical protein
MQDIEEEVRLVREFKEDEEVEDQVGAGFRIWVAPKPGIPYENKTMVALGMLPKDEDFRQYGDSKCLHYGG